MKPIPLIDGTDGARLPVKPAYGSPCNGCGWCCASEPCGIAREFIGADGEGPCPALEREGGRFVCGLIVRPLVYLGRAVGLAERNFASCEINDLGAFLGREIAEALGAGKGCCADGP